MKTHATAPSYALPFPDDAVHYLAWGRLMTHVGACPECLSGDPFGCDTAHALRRAWQAVKPRWQ